MVTLALLRGRRPQWLIARFYEGGALYWACQFYGSLEELEALARVLKELPVRRFVDRDELAFFMRHVDRALVRESVFTTPFRDDRSREWKGNGKGRVHSENGREQVRTCVAWASSLAKNTGMASRTGRVR